MFVTDVKCPQATRQIIPNSRTGSSKASASEAVVHTWHHTHVVKGRPEGLSAAAAEQISGRRGLIIDYENVSMHRQSGIRAASADMALPGDSRPHDIAAVQCASK